ncbi:MAG: HypC/HybG/HupF family hydrogenase formation chaperone [Acidimicrobiia bacterium]|nr:HypC/HybG/HupF family hydrogenase formation chaperone [Acidimicrobiia bacterium]NNF10023.1 HypC/HybG/HupF family hydrogenase formation chaperone [Acidimicrobiia bacterium]NNL71697.1 HypC/HybG/HupF family hydrogenase formation chaperone [Acidimicrobiia bacterium]
MCLAIPARIVAISEGAGLDRQGRIVVEGTERDVNLALVPEAAVGDYVITHAGFALRRTEPLGAEATTNDYPPATGG